MNPLKRRILDLSFKHKLSHIGSCLSTVDTIDKIYSIKKKDEPFILDNAHSSLALYVILEKYEGKDAEDLLKKHGVHCNRELADGIWASGGSLGSSVSIGIGYAFSDRKRIVYIVGSDGGVNEGSWYEALRIAADYRLENLRISIIANGYGAYSEIEAADVDNRLNVFYPTLLVRTNLYAWPDYLNGLEAHYHVLTKEEYEEITAMDENR